MYSVDQIGYGTQYQGSTCMQYTKYRLCEPDAAQFFLDDTKFSQDEVYSRTVDLTSVNLITAAALFYHEKCYGKYSWKYERARSGNDNVKNNVETKLTNRKEQLFHLAFCRT